MDKRLTAILLSVVVGLTTCNRGRSPVAPTRELNADEYDVVSTYITGTFGGQESKERVSKDVFRIVIFNKTSSGDDDLLLDENGRRIPWEKTVESLRKKAPALQQTTIDAFRKVNTQQALLLRSFHFPIPYEVIGSDQLESAFKRNGGDWPAYYKQYPGSQGILTLSRVGFSADGTQALFYFSNRCGPLCGGGRYVVMEKRNARWAIGKEIEMWVS